MISWSYVEPLHDDLSVGEFEADYGFLLPEEYKSLVYLYNSGYPSCNSFLLPTGEWCQMKHLYSFNREDAENMWDFNSAENIGAGIIAFADDSFGNQIAFRMADNAIVFADYDSDEITKIADSFSDFINQLTDQE